MAAGWADVLAIAERMSSKHTINGGHRIYRDFDLKG
jgi:hypothetical protein